VEMVQVANGYGMEPLRIQTLEGECYKDPYPLRHFQNPIGKFLYAEL
jgi:hypothetical protein